MSVILFLCVGLGIFLFGMRLMEDNLALLGSNKVKAFLSRSTERPINSVVSGTVITAILQSSSMVSLIVLAFASAGMIPLFNAVGVILGANLGTTFTGWIVATFGFKLDLAAIAVPIFGLSALFYVFGKSAGRMQAFAGLFVGLGVLLFGLEQMKSAVADLPDLIDTQRLAGLSSVSYLLVGMILTAIIQSSSAMTMIALTALHGGLVDLSGAAAIVIGADIGTTSTTLLGSLSGRPIARQLALAHLIYNLCVDALAFFLMLPMLPIVLERLGITDPLYGLVLFHSSFNLLGLIIFVPILKPFSNWLGQRFTIAETAETRYLHATPVAVTEAAIVALYHESRSLIMRVFELNLKVLGLSSSSAATGESKTHCQRISGPDFIAAYESCKRIEAEIHQYYAKIHTTGLAQDVTDQAANLLDSARSAIYAAKTLKDIDDDLDYFVRDLSSESSLALLPEALQGVLNVLNRGLRGEIQPASVADFCTEMRDKSAHCQTRMSEQVMEALRDGRVPYSQLPSLLNAAREIVYATYSLIDAYEKLMLVPLRIRHQPLKT